VVAQFAPRVALFAGLTHPYLYRADTLNGAYAVHDGASFDSNYCTVHITQGLSPELLSCASIPSGNVKQSKRFASIS